MDFFQGSSPPNFISFCLANQPGDDPQVQANTSADIPSERVLTTTSAGVSNVVRRPQPSPPPFPPTRPPRSPSSPDSNVDVTAYADEKVLLLQQVQEQEEGQVAKDSETREQEIEESATEDLSAAGIEPQNATLFFQTSTPTKNLPSESTELNLKQLEAGLTIAPSSLTALPELLTTCGTSANVSAASFLQHETDESSSVCDAPKLPTGVTDVIYLDDVTGTEDAGDTSSQASGPSNQ